MNNGAAVKTNDLLQIGDVFAVKSGLKIMVKIPEMFIFDNKRTSKELGSTIISVGEVKDNGGRKKFKTSQFEGEYLVVDAKMDGGSDYNDRDYYPPGHHVTAKKMGADGQPDENGVTIDFYQSGSFTHRNDPQTTPVLRRYTREVQVIWKSVSMLFPEA
jgi:hypothetical protein